MTDLLTHGPGPDLRESPLAAQPGESLAARLERLHRLHHAVGQEIAELEEDGRERPAPAVRPRGAGGGVVTVAALAGAPSDPAPAVMRTPVDDLELRLGRRRATRPAAPVAPRGVVTPAPQRGPRPVAVTTPPERRRELIALWAVTVLAWATVLGGAAFLLLR